MRIKGPLQVSIRTEFRVASFLLMPYCLIKKAAMGHTATFWMGINSASLDERALCFLKIHSSGLLDITPVPSRAPAGVQRVDAPILGSDDGPKSRIRYR